MSETLDLYVESAEIHEWDCDAEESKLYINNAIDLIETRIRYCKSNIDEAEDPDKAQEFKTELHELQNVLVPIIYSLQDVLLQYILRGESNWKISVVKPKPGFPLDTLCALLDLLNINYSIDGTNTLLHLVPHPSIHVKSKYGSLR